jgi:aspartyl protease family protein
MAERPEFLPDHALALPQRILRIHADSGGQFDIFARANDEAVTFLVDTGATEGVLGKAEARGLGIAGDDLKFDHIAHMANGPIRFAVGRLHSLSLGRFTFNDIIVLVSEGELDEPLLGMAFLRRMNIAISNGLLTLSQDL